MRAFLETTFGPEELEVLKTVLEDWRKQHALPKDDPDVSLAAEIMINLFREGNHTAAELKQAVAEHRALADLMA